MSAPASKWRDHLHLIALSVAGTSFILWFASGSLMQKRISERANTLWQNAKYHEAQGNGLHEGIDENLRPVYRRSRDIADDYVEKALATEQSLKTTKEWHGRFFWIGVGGAIVFVVLAVQAKSSTVRDTGAV